MVVCTAACLLNSCGSGAVLLPGRPRWNYGEKLSFPVSSMFLFHSFSSLLSITQQRQSDSESEALAGGHKEVLGCFRFDKGSRLLFFAKLDAKADRQMQCTGTSFPECVAKGSCFCLGGLGAGPCSFRFRDCGRERSRATVLCPMRCALRIGLEGGRLGEALWRRAVVIAGESVVWVAPCRCDCWGECWGEPGLGGAVPL